MPGGPDVIYYVLPGVCFVPVRDSEIKTLSSLRAVLCL